MNIKMKGIYKSFGEVDVLKDVEIDIKHGEIHALMGENGAGKSTLIKVLTGVYTKDKGEVFIDGEIKEISSIEDSQRYKIAYVHQELNVVKDLSIVENMFLGKELKKKSLIIDRKKMYSIAKSKLDLLGVELDPNTLMRDLTVGYQQMIEIAKALLMNAELIILDEPTAALTNKEIKALFEVVKDLQKKNVSFLYVSHRMDEIFTLCERISVLRDGKYIGTQITKDITEDTLVKMMTGKVLDELFSIDEIELGEEILKIQGLTRNNKFNDINFSLKKGEILGFAGLMGSGRSEIMHCIFGSDRFDRGNIYIENAIVNIKSPLDAKKYGIAFVTEDRKEQGLTLDFTIADNIILPSLKKVKNFFIKENKIKNISDKNIKKLNIKCAGSNQKVKDLSGGNQQKVVFSKWLETNPKILILDEPTRGVDIGAKKEIYDIINQLKKEGVAIILVSSELSEVIGLSDRVAVMHQGNLAKIYSNKPFVQDEILKTAFLGGKNGE